MLDKKVKHLNDRKLSILLFLMDYQHYKNFEKKIFDETYIKNNKNPQGKTLNELFEIILNEEILEDEDERVYLIEELLEYVDIEIIKKDNFNELQFFRNENEETFDDELFEKEELKTINKIIKEYKDQTVRNCANACFDIELFRETLKDEVII